MSPFAQKLEALLKTDEQGQPICEQTTFLVQMAIALEKGRYRCSQCGRNSVEGADEEGDGGWWCSNCMEVWERHHGVHWEDGTPLET
jgi:ribosomal protein L37AE/L43A